jgi:hypothetical protein
MLSPQLEYPLTLAEVLFEELETTCADIDESEREIEVRSTQVENRGLAFNPRQQRRERVDTR